MNDNTEVGLLAAVCCQHWRTSESMEHHLYAKHILREFNFREFSKFAKIQAKIIRYTVLHE
jgi:hypothetical protein